jgi:hypothetical protein
MIVPPNPRLAGNNDNKRTLNVMAAIIAVLHLHLSSKKANCSVIVMAAVESLVLIYILLGSMSRCMHLSI